MEMDKTKKEFTCMDCGVTFLGARKAPPTKRCPTCNTVWRIEYRRVHSRNYYQNNQLALREKRKEYYLNNREARIEYFRNYRKTHPRVNAKYEATYRERLRTENVSSLDKLCDIVIDPDATESGQEKLREFLEQLRLKKLVQRGGAK